MRRWLVALLLCILILSAVVVYLIYLPPSVNVGIFYYVWYDPSLEVSWERSKIIDQPVLGFYNSSDPAVIRQHLIWMKELGIDFVVISWWGFYDDYGKFTDNAAKQVFKIAEDNMINLKFAIMVEPFNESGSSYDYAGIYNHIYDDFVLPHSSVYYNDGKPLICFFNDEHLTGKGTIPCDGRFDTILVGQSDYVQWVYTDLNYYVKPTRNPYTTQTSVTPRYDDSRVRTPSCVVDPNLTQGIYDKEWENAIQLLKERKIDTILITSWNEYPERTAIEPHYDATAPNLDPYFLYNKTRDYINQIKLLVK